MKKIKYFFVITLLLTASFFAQLGRDLDDGIKFAAKDLISNMAIRSIKKVAIKEILNLKLKQSGKLGLYAQNIIKNEFKLSGLFATVQDFSDLKDPYSIEAIVEGFYEELDKTIKLELRMTTLGGRLISLSSVEINKNEKTKALLEIEFSKFESQSNNDSTILTQPPQSKKILEIENISIELAEATKVNDDIIFVFYFFSKKNTIIENYYDGARIIDEENNEYLPYSNLPRILDLPANIRIKAEMKFRNIKLRNKTKISSIEWNSSIGKIIFYNIEIKI